MLKKVFKYEWKSIFPLLLGVHGVGLVVAIICRIGIELLGGIKGELELMACLLLFAAIMAIGCIIAYTHFYCGYRFYKSVFTQQGYLTNTLPVTADQLIWGKGFTMLIWSFLDFLWAVIAIMILALSSKEAFDFLRELPGALTGLFRPATPMFARLIVLSVILTPFFMMLQIYVSAAIGNLFTGHKLLATIGTYIGIGFVQQVLALIIIGFSSPYLAELSKKADLHSGDMYVQYYVPAERFLNLTVLLSLIFSILCSIGFYFLCRYVLNRKLNLE